MEEKAERAQECGAAERVISRAETRLGGQNIHRVNRFFLFRLFASLKDEGRRERERDGERERR